MNAYEAKQTGRKERLEGRASAATRASNAALASSRRAIEDIPFGQPILVGHHSEGRHRAAISRADSQMRKCCDESDKAKHYERSAAAVGKGGISSDDPDALIKLRAELVSVQAAQVKMKAINKAIKVGKTAEAQTAALLALGLSAEDAQKALKPDFCGRVGFPGYALTNNNSNARRIAKRIEELEARRSRETVAVEGNGYSYSENTEENRCMFEFPGKPAAEVRAVLKAHAFIWSPSRGEDGAWVRQLTNAGIYAAQQVRAALETMPKN